MSVKAFFLNHPVATH